MKNIDPAILVNVNRSKVRIQPSSGWASLKLRETWDFRELMVFLIWRDIKVRNKQTVLGAAWLMSPVYVAGYRLKRCLKRFLANLRIRTLDYLKR